MRTDRSFIRAAGTSRLWQVVAVVLSSSACGWSNQAKGTAVGVGAGAAVGGAIGSQTGSTARGAIIGAVVGGATGAIIGHRMDQQAEELEVAIPGAVVTRIGEGMVVTFASGLLYDFDSEVIRADAAQNLRQLAASLDRYADTDLLIVGHTDALGSSEYNQDLSNRRADSASRYLELQGVATRRLQTSGRGEMEPVGSNDTEAGRQMNRRIEVAIFATDAARSGGGR
jgi:outer membrane protein OmpA-like peptidoglycan-associated protein